MAIDVIGILLILLFFIRGYMRGFIVALFSVLAILLGIIISLRLSHSFAAWLQEKKYVSGGWALFVSYALLFIAVMLVVRLVARLFQGAIDAAMLGTVNKLLGGLVYAFLGAVLWSSILWIGGRAHIITANAIAASRTYPRLSLLAPWFFEQVGKLLPFARNTFTELEHFFDTLNQQMPGHVGTH